MWLIGTYLCSVKTGLSFSSWIYGIIYPFGFLILLFCLNFRIRLYTYIYIYIYLLVVSFMPLISDPNQVKWTHTMVVPWFFLGPLVRLGRQHNRFVCPAYLVGRTKTMRRVMMDLQRFSHSLFIVFILITWVYLCFIVRIIFPCSILWFYYPP